MDNSKIEKLLNEYTTKITRQYDKIEELNEERDLMQRRSGQSEINFLLDKLHQKQLIAIENARLNAYIQAKVDIESLLQILKP